MAEPKPTNDFTHLWNDLPFEKRVSLMPYQMETKILHLWQVRKVIVDNHKSTLALLDSWIRNIESDLEKHRAEQEKRNG